MENDGLTFDLSAVRGTDSNTLLRMYDWVCERRTTASSQQLRDRAERAFQRIVKELRKRKVEF